jgi:hypothetical protein
MRFVRAFFRAAVPSLAGLLLGSSAFAATLQPMQGEVLINHGAGFQRVAQQTTAGVGDSVMVGKDGSAQIVYNAQCSVAVKPGNVVTIAAEPPCPKTGQLEPTAGQMNLGACGGDKGFCAPPVEDRSWLLPAGVVVAAGVVGGLCAGNVICEHAASP